jgi:hypothetical protein
LGLEDAMSDSKISERCAAPGCTALPTYRAQTPTERWEGAEFSASFYVCDQHLTEAKRAGYTRIAAIAAPLLHQPPRDLSAVHPVRGIDGRRVG